VIHEKKVAEVSEGSGDTEKTAKWATVFESISHLMESRDAHFRDLFLTTHRSFLKFVQMRRDARERGRESNNMIDLK
jgi:ClpP class serine protease